MTANDPVDLRQLGDLRGPWCLRVVVTLRIADQLASGPSAIDDLAAAAACDAESLRRVLRHLVAMGVFEEPTPGRFALNEAAELLRDPSHRLYFDLDGFGGRMTHAWSTLPTVVRTGKAAYHELFGRPFWEDLNANPDVGASFDAFMHESHTRPEPAILIDSDWDSVSTVVDVGGGKGGLLAEILRAHPMVAGTLIDLPATVARAAGVFEAAGVTDRVTAVGQSFFEPLPAGASLYVLSAILNDWPDPEAAAILFRCAAAARPAGRVVVLGGVSPDEVSVDDLWPEMVLVGGKNRSLAEFSELARGAGLGVRAADRLTDGRFCVECVPT